MPVILLAAILLLALPGAAEPLRVGYFDLPPHTPLPQQALEEGVAIAYFQRIARQMQIEEVSYQRYPLPRLLQMLERGSLDVALLLGRSPEREQALVYPAEPFVVSQSVLALPMQHPLQQVASVEQLLPLRIGVWRDGYRSPMLRDARLQITAVGSDMVLSRSLRLILAGRIDAFYHPDDLAVRHELGQQGLQGQIRLLALPGQQVPLYTVFSKAAAGAYLRRYEQALARVGGQQSYARFFAERLLPASDP